MARLNNTGSLAEWLDQFDEPLFIRSVSQFVWQSVSESCLVLEEHQLTQWLTGKKLFEGLDEYPAMLAFFAKHFLVRRSLYRLRDEMKQKGFSIHFDLMRFTLMPISSFDDGLLHFSEKSVSAANVSEVRASDVKNPGAKTNQEMVNQEYSLIAEFYDDLDTLYRATPDSVSRLISDFWKRYEAYQRVGHHNGHDHQCGGSYKILGLTSDASWNDIKQAYRRLAAQKHPDKGGEAGAFMAIQQAYEDLRLLHKKPKM